jgi:hypothetical protein
MKKKPVAITIARAHDIGFSCSRRGAAAVTAMVDNPFQYRVGDWRASAT